MSPPKLRYYQYVELARKFQRQQPEWRWGQALFNALVLAWPELAERVRATSMDPFHSTGGDNTVLVFLDYCRDAWQKVSDDAYVR